MNYTVKWLQQGASCEAHVDMLEWGVWLVRTLAEAGFTASLWQGASLVATLNIPGVSPQPNVAKSD